LIDGKLVCDSIERASMFY